MAKSGRTWAVTIGGDNWLKLIKYYSERERSSIHPYPNPPPLKGESCRKEVLSGTEN